MTIWTSIKFPICDSQILNDARVVIKTTKYFPHTIGENKIILFHAKTKTQEDTIRGHIILMRNSPFSLFFGNVQQSNSQIAKTFEVDRNGILHVTAIRDVAQKIKSDMIAKANFETV